MRKGLLIGVGTLGGLGAVLAVTPPHFSSSKLTGGSSAPLSNNNQATQPAPTPTQVASTPTPTATKKAAKKSSTKKSTTTKSTTATTSNSTAQSTPTPTPTQAAASSGASGTFTGSTSQTRFGPVQVQVTVVNGKITAAKALQYPNGDFRSASISQQAIPYLVQETLQAQSSNIQGVGGASYTSYGWFQSLQSALAKAGMK
jgi:uncharacterized protein with FMN-binding domain